MLEHIKIRGFEKAKDFAMSTTDAPQALPAGALLDQGDSEHFSNEVKRVVIRAENAPIRIGFGNIAPDQAGNGFPINVDETFVFSSFAEANAAQIASANAGSPADISIIAYY